MPGSLLSDGRWVSAMVEESGPNRGSTLWESQFDRRTRHLERGQRFARVARSRLVMGAHGHGRREAPSLHEENRAEGRLHRRR